MQQAKSGFGGLKEMFTEEAFSKRQILHSHQGTSISILMLQGPTSGYRSPQFVVPVIMWVSGLVHDGSELYHQGAGTTLFFGPVSNSNYVTIAQLLPLEVHSQTVSNSAVLNSPQMNKHRHHFLQIKPDWLKHI